ncbi:MAG: heme A synthase [Bacteroidetes bacterium]|nr:heme A synthase [Bacteroidota bacterium]
MNKEERNMYSLNRKSNKLVGYWLLFGVVMILIQVMLGGITRLTQSGLSITNWDVILGTLPPMNQQDWMKAFEGYKQIPQYEVLNKGMSLEEFKWIYFWEYLHRLWGRILGFVFLIPMVLFIAKNQIKKNEVYKYIIVLVLGGMQGVMGWVMVKSGLEERIFVDPVKLMLHLILAAALILLVYRLALENLIPMAIRPYNFSVRKLLGVIIILTLIQISFGGLVAGSRAALAYPTWPKMGAVWVPTGMMDMTPAWRNFIENAGMLQFMHRVMAYVLTIFVFVVIVRCARISRSRSFHKARFYLLVVLLIQILLGILTVIGSKMEIPVALGVFHQLTAFLFLLVTVYLHYTYKYQ